MTLNLHTTKSNSLEYLAARPGKHIAVLFEDDREGKLLQYWYLVHGLAQGEHCVYLSLGDLDEDRKKMRESGVDLDYYENEIGILRIKKLKPLRSEDAIPSAVQELASKALETEDKPTRAVINMVNGAARSELGPSLIKSLEQTLQREFSGCDSRGLLSSYKGSMLCNYQVDRPKLKLISNIISSHDATVIVSKSREMQLVSHDQSDGTTAELHESSLLPSVNT